MYNEDYDDSEESQNSGSRIKQFYENNKKVIWILIGFIAFILIATLLTSGGNSNPKIDENKPTITVEPKELEVEKGSSRRLIASVTNYSNAKISWTSSNQSIATVDENGLVIGVDYGKVTITATVIYKDEPIMESCEVTVSEGDPSISLTGISFPSGDLMMGVNTEYNIYLTKTPTKGYVTNKVFTSSNPSVVTVDEEGKVKAVGVGTANISVSINDNKFNDTIKVYVVSQSINPVLITNVESIDFNSTLLKVKVGDKTRIEYSVLPSNADINNITWTSSDESIVKVSNDGTIQALKIGTATIKAEALSGVSNSIIVEVESNIVDVTEINVSSTNITMTAGTQQVLTPIIVPSNASNKTIIFTSSDTSVVSVSANTGGTSATLYAYKAGSAQIEMKSLNGITQYILVTVVKNGSGGGGSGGSGGGDDKTIVVNPKDTVVFKSLSQALSHYVSGNQTISVTLHGGVSKIKYCYNNVEETPCTPSVESSSSITKFTVPAGQVSLIRIIKYDSYGNEISPSATATSYVGNILQYYVNTKGKNASVTPYDQTTVPPVVQTSCNDGQYRDASNQCQNCPYGYKCPDKTNKVKCTGQEYQKNTGQTSCNTCNGTVKQEIVYNGSQWESINYDCDTSTTQPPVTQTTCNEGQYRNANNQCEYCPEGYKCPDKTNKVKCEGNQYQNVKGQISCNTCNGKIVTKKVQVGNTMEEVNYDCGGSTKCDPGSYPYGKNCFQCDMGYKCPDGTKREPCTGNVDYQDEKGQTTCKQCTNGTITSTNYYGDVVNTYCTPNKPVSSNFEISVSKNIVNIGTVWYYRTANITINATNDSISKIFYCEVDNSNKGECVNTNANTYSDQASYTIWFPAGECYGAELNKTFNLPASGRTSYSPEHPFCIYKNHRIYIKAVSISGQISNTVYVDFNW